MFLNISLDKKSKIKLYRQLFDAIVELIKTKELKENTKLPSVRTVSKELDIGKNTVTKAYLELEKAEYIYSVEKSGYFVKNPDNSVPIKKENRQSGTENKADTKKLITVDSIVNENSVTEEAAPFMLKDKVSDEGEISSVSLRNKKLDSKLLEKDEEEINSLMLKDKVSDEGEISSVSLRNKKIDSQLLDTDKEENKSQDTDSASKLVEINSNLDAKLLLKTQETSVKDTDQNIEPENSFYNSQNVDTKNILYRGTDLESSIEKIYHYVLKQKHYEVDFAGFQEMLAKHLLKYHGIKANPDLIFPSHSIEQLMLNILSLNTLKNPNACNSGKGLLKLAESYAGNIKPVIALTENSLTNAAEVFTAAGYNTTKLPQEESGINLNSLITTGSNIAYILSPGEFDNNFLVTDFDQLRVDLFAWVNSCPYRFILEHDISSDVNKSPCLKSFDTNDKIIYFHTLADDISDYINLSICVMPEKIAKEYKEKFGFMECTLSPFEQAVLNEYLH